MKEKMKIVKDKVYMFSYGMNTNPGIIGVRCNAKIVDVAVLPDWRLEFNLHADVRSCINDEVFGLVWDIDVDDVDIVDQIEGYPFYYKKINHVVYSKNDPMLAYSCFCYHMTDEHQTLGLPTESYWNLVLEGYKYNDIPAEQLYNALERAENYEKVYS